MKFVIVFVALFAVAFAAPGNIDAEAQVLRFESDVQPNGFNYQYETSNGINEQASGKLLNEGSDAEAISVQGSYSFVGDDGQTYTVTYVADENGFQPQGAHLPVAPEA